MMKTTYNRLGHIINAVKEFAGRSLDAGEQTNLVNHIPMSLCKLFKNEMDHAGEMIACNEIVEHVKDKWHEMIKDNYTPQI